MSSMQIRFSHVIEDREFYNDLHSEQKQLSKHLAEGGTISTLANQLCVHRSTLDTMALDIFISYRKAKFDTLKSQASLSCARNGNQDESSLYSLAR